MESDGSYNLTIWRTEMDRIPRAIYTAEFRAEAVKLVEMAGVSVARLVKAIFRKSAGGSARRANLRLSLLGLSRNLRT